MQLIESFDYAADFWRFEREMLFLRRIDFFRWMRRNSLLDTCQRLRRTALRTPLLAIFLRKRRNNCSCDSFGRSSTVGKFPHLLYVEELEKHACGVYIQATKKDAYWEHTLQHTPL